MTQSIHVSAALVPDPADIRTEFFESSYGPRAQMRLGDHLTLATAGTTAEALRQLAACALELADWAEQKEAAAPRLAVTA